MKERTQIDVPALMGKIVLVEFEYVRKSLYDKRYQEKHWRRVKKHDRPGWVVGARKLQQGRVHYGYGYDDPNTWEQTGPTTKCLLVAYWHTMNPVKVPLDGWRLAPETTFPYQYSESSWRSSHREYMRNESVHWPRNEAGQWVKKTSAHKGENHVRAQDV